MATVLDITGKLKNEEKSIKLGDHVFRVDDTKNTMMEVMALFEQSQSNDIAAIDAVIEKLLGKKASAEIDKMNLRFEDYKVIFIALMACVSNETYEEAESRFQKAK